MARRDHIDERTPHRLPLRATLHTLQPRARRVFQRRDNSAPRRELDEKAARFLASLLAKESLREDVSESSTLELREQIDEQGG